MARTEEIVNSVSRISTNTRIKGELSSSNDLRIDGYFEGKIISKGRIVIGETAEVCGEIVCTNADVWGKLKGDLFKMINDEEFDKKAAAVDEELHAGLVNPAEARTQKDEKHK